MTARGLRRFAAPAAAPARPPLAAPDPVAGDHTPAPTPPAAPTVAVSEPGVAAPDSAVERCEMCGEVVAAEHGHVVDTEQRSLKCACRPCYLLFTNPEAGGGRFRAVPDRYRHDPDHPIGKADWEGLGIPVNTAFVLRGADGPAAFYPSPAGATECLLDLHAWADLGTTHPLLDQAQPEVEAILVKAGDDSVEHFLVPIDACYQLVGIVRLYWQGFDGGAEAAEHIAAFFADLRARARVCG